MPRKKKTIIEEQIPDEEIVEEKEQVEEEESEITPSEQVSEFIDFLNEAQDKNFKLKIFKRVRNKTYFVDEIEQPDHLPSEAEIRDQYGTGAFQLMLIYKKDGKYSAKSVYYNIYDPNEEFKFSQPPKENEEEDVEYVEEGSDLNSLLALMIERDKEFARMQMQALQQHYTSMMELMMTQQNQMLQTLATIMSARQNSDYAGLADLIQTIAEISGVAPQRNGLSEILGQVLPLLIPLLQGKGGENVELIKKLQELQKQTQGEK